MIRRYSYPAMGALAALWLGVWFISAVVCWGFWYIVAAITNSRESSVSFGDALLISAIVLILNLIWEIVFRRKGKH